VRKPWDLVTQGAYLQASVDEHIVLIGLVALWGDVVEHQHVYRAQRATLLRLWIVRGGDWGAFEEDLAGGDVTLALKARYRVPIGSLPMSQFGPNTFSALADELSQRAFEQQLK
jgi:hypothetical protein